MSFFYNGKECKGVYMNGLACPMYANGVKIWPTSKLFDGIDFIYFANNYQTNVGILNSVQNTEFGTYGLYNSSYNLTKNGTGADCYLSHPNSSSYHLRMSMTTTQLTNFKAINKPYTFYMRVYSTSGIGGVFSWRTESGSTYNYMIRTNDNKIQLHTTSGLDSLNLVDGNVIKIEIFSNTATITDLDSKLTDTKNIGTTRSMGNMMLTILAGAASQESTEYNLAKLYGLAGVQRRTTEEEDELMRQMLHSQSVN